MVRRTTSVCLYFALELSAANQQPSISFFSWDPSKVCVSDAHPPHFTTTLASPKVHVPAKDMSKRKRSWEETSLATAERAGAAELAAYDGDNFARPAIVDAGRQSSGYMSEAAGDGVISLESVPVDQPLLESSRNGSKAEMLWKPRGSGAAMIAPEALPGLTRKITACAACRKQKVRGVLDASKSILAHRSRLDKVRNAKRCSALCAMLTTRIIVCLEQEPSDPSRRNKVSIHALFTQSCVHQYHCEACCLLFNSESETPETFLS